MKRSQTFILLLNLFILSGCVKDSFDLNYVELNSPTSYDIEEVLFIDENIGIAVGGDQFEEGIVLRTLDGGANWSINTISNKSLYALDYHPQKGWITAGQDGKFFVSPDGINWTFHRLNLWKRWTGIAFRDGDYGIAVSGVNYQEGTRAIIENDQISASETELIHEYVDVCFSDQTTAHTVGYGIVSKSIDAGLTWTPSEVKGDFFRAVQFPSSDIGYIVGYSGSILKTTDAGETWVKQRNGNSIFVSNERFTDVYFVDDNTGFIVGDLGLFWKTTNGGETWEADKDFPKVDLKGVHAINGVGYIVANEGRIFKFEY